MGNYPHLDPSLLNLMVIVRVHRRWQGEICRKNEISLWSTRGLSQFRCEQITAKREKNRLWPRMTGLRECHSNCGAITGTRWWVIALHSTVSPPWRTPCTLAHLWRNLWCWHLKCWFWSTYANCCNFPDEAPFWYLDVAKIVLHFLCGPRCHLHCVVSAQSATESEQNCKQIASDCQHCEKGKLLANLFKPLVYFHQLWYLVFMIA